MIYTLKTLDKSIEDTKSMAAHDHTNGNPTRATYEDGFADGQASLYQTIEAQANRIAELENMIRELDYAAMHEHEIGGLPRLTMTIGKARKLLKG